MPSRPVHPPLEYAQVQVLLEAWRALPAEIADAMPQAVWQADAGGRICCCNHRSLGADEPIPASDWFDSIHPEDRAAAELAWRQARLQGGGFDLEHRHFDPGSGTFRWHRCRAVPLRSKDGAVPHWFGTSTDIDDYRRSIAASEHERSIAQQGLERLRVVMASLVDGLIVADATGRLIEINAAARRTLGLQDERDLGRSLVEFEADFELRTMDGRQLPLRQWPMSRVLAGETVDGDELRVLARATGKEWILCFRGAPVIDAGGRVEYAVMSMHEVTTVRRTESELQRSNALLAAITDSTVDAVFVKDRRGRYLFANPAADRWSMGSGRTAVGKTDADLFGAEAAAAIRANDEEVMTSHVPSEREFTLQAHGIERTWQVTVSPHQATDGTVLGVVGIARDVTERKRVAAALRASEQRFRELADAMPILVFVADADRTITDVNHEGLRLLAGKAVAEWAAIVHPDDLPAVLAGWSDAGKDGRTFEVELRLRDQDKGGYRWHLGCAIPVRSPEGQVVKWFGTCTDIHDIKSVTAALYAEQDRFRRLVATAPGVIHTFVRRPDGSSSFSYASPAIAEIFGVDAARLAKDASPALARIVPEDRDALFAAFDAAQATMTDGRAEFRVQHPQRGEVWIELRATPRREADGSISWYGFFHDISDRRRSEQRLRSILTSAIDAIITVDEQGVIRSTNPAGERLFGWPEPELVGQRLDLLLPDAVRSRHTQHIADFLRTGTAKVIGQGTEVEVRRRDGSTVSVDLSVSVFMLEGTRQFTCVARDISGRKKLQAQFLQAQKMEAVGRLAAGVAHDFNNLLTVINGYGEMLLDQSSKDDPQQESLAAIHAAGKRAAALTRQLLAFSRKAPMVPEVVDLNALVSQVGGLLRRLIGEDVSLHLELGPGLARLRVDPTQIEQVLMNLVINARDAMPEGGRLTIVTANRAATADSAAQVELTVVDTGTGMSEEVRARIFEPFFTTKGEGKGTGLGLATVYGIVEQNGGNIEVESEIGHGTTMRVLLPAAEATETTTVSGTQPKPLRGSETILLVEDEEVVRCIARAALEASGFRVLEAADGAGALRQVVDHPGRIDLLVTDVVMPGMNGGQLADQLRGRLPHLRVLFMSGYFDSEILPRGLPSELLMTKPFTPHGLLARVRAVLDAT